MVAASKLRHAIVVGSSEAEALQAVSKIETIHFGHDDMRAYYAEDFHPHVKNPDALELKLIRPNQPKSSFPTLRPIQQPPPKQMLAIWSGKLG